MLCPHPYAARRADQVANDPRSQPAGHREIAVDHTSYRPKQGGRVEILGQVADCAEADRLEDISPVGRHGQHHEPSVRKTRSELAQELKTGHARQIDVDEHDVGMAGGGKPECFLGRYRLCDDRDITRGQRLSNRSSDQSVVVDQHHSDLTGHCSDPRSTGTSRMTLVPSERLEFMSRRPPTSWARSRMLLTPNRSSSTASGSKPRPLSMTVNRTYRPSVSTCTRTIVASACLPTLLSASWMIRRTSASA